MIIIQCYQCSYDPTSVLSKRASGSSVAKPFHAHIQCILMLSCSYIYSFHRGYILTLMSFVFISDSDSISQTSLIIPLSLVGVDYRGKYGTSFPYRVVANRACTLTLTW